MITRANERKLMTRLEKRNITLKNPKKLLEDVINGKINKKKAENMYINIAEDVNKLNKLKSTVSRKNMLPIFKRLKKIDDEVDDETVEEPDTTDMPELESEESAAQRREHEGKGLKILTPPQMPNRLPISLAQLKAGNNPQKME